MFDVHKRLTNCFVAWGNQFVSLHVFAGRELLDKLWTL